MGSKYANDSAPQKNPKVCKSDQKPSQRNSAGDWARLQMEVHVDYDLGSGLHLVWHITDTMEYSPVDQSWLFGPTPNNPSLLCEWEIHPDQMHGQFTVSAWYNGVLVLTAPSSWVPLESRDPIDSGVTRYPLIGSGDHITFRVTG